MIEKNEVIDLLIEACPSFAEPLESYLNARGDGKRLLYPELAELSKHLIRLEKAGDRGEFGAVFPAIERFHTEGSTYVKDAMVIGFLGGHQYNCQIKGVDPEIFAQYLGIESLVWWVQLKFFKNRRGSKFDF